MLCACGYVRAHGPRQCTRHTLKKSEWTEQAERLYDWNGAIGVVQTFGLRMLRLSLQQASWACTNIRDGLAPHRLNHA